MTEEKAEKIRSIGPLKVLQEGVSSGRISSAEFDEHQALAVEIGSHPENHMRMVEILEKAFG